jgi:hypothetical protein
VKVEKVQREKVRAASAGPGSASGYHGWLIRWRAIAPRFRHDADWLWVMLPTICRRYGLGKGARGDKQAFWKNEPILVSSKKDLKCLIINNLQPRLEVVKKQQFEKQSQFEETPAVLGVMQPSSRTNLFARLTQVRQRFERGLTKSNQNEKK